MHIKFNEPIQGIKLIQENQFAIDDSFFQIQVDFVESQESKMLHLSFEVFADKKPKKHILIIGERDHQ